MHNRVIKVADAYKLDQPERLQWLPPADVLRLLHLAAGMKIADVGAGTGYFSIPLARAVGDLGHVFAVDLQTEMLEILRQKLEQPSSPSNISLQQGNASELPLQDDSVHMVFCANVWHEIEDPVNAIREATRVCVPGGRIAIVDWREDCAPPPGPPQEHRLSADFVVQFLLGQGCRGICSERVGLFEYLIMGELPAKSETIESFVRCSR